MEDRITVDIQGGVADVRLVRVDKMNALDDAMFEALIKTGERLKTEAGVRAVVLSGAGRAFCAGADLAEFDFEPGPDLVARADPGPLIDQAFNPTVRRLQSLRMPTLAAVNGVAAGAGASLAMTCDIAIAAPGASFIQAFSKIGLVPDAGGSWFLTERLGLARAMALAMTGDKLSATQARDWGMIWDVADDCLAAAQTMAARLADMPTAALVATRQLLRDSHTRTLNQQLDVERDNQSAMGRTHDYIEGVMAFREKRPARFTGR